MNKWSCKRVLPSLSDDGFVRALVSVLSAGSLLVTFAVLEGSASSQQHLAPSSESIEAFIDREQQRGAATSALIVMRSGRVAFERYAASFGPSTQAKMYSVTKTMTALAIGAASKRSHIDVNASLCQYVDRAQDTSWCAVTVAQLLRMQSGARWSESYGARDTNSDVLQALYGSGALDHEAFVLRKDLQHAPGAKFLYSSGDSLLLAGVLRKVAGPDGFRRWLSEFVFGPMGLGTVSWEEDASGNLDTASGLFLTAPQMLGIGQSLLAAGTGASGAVVTEDFYREMTSPSGGQAYGYQVWLNRAATLSSGLADSDKETTLFPSSTRGTYAAVGHFGQYIVVIPEEQTVVVRIGDDRLAPFNMDGLLALVRAQEGGLATRATASSMGFHKVFPERRCPKDAVGSLCAAWQAAAAPLAVSQGAPYAGLVADQKSELVELSLGFASLTYCSCREVSKLGEAMCAALAAPPGLEAIPVSEPWPVVPLFEAVWRDRAKSALFQLFRDQPSQPVMPGCQIVDEQSYPVPGGGFH